MAEKKLTALRRVNLAIQSFTQEWTSWVSYLAMDQSQFVTGSIRFCIQVPTDICHMICGMRSIRLFFLGGGHKMVWDMRKKRKNRCANWKDYWIPISSEFLRPSSVRRRRLGRKRPEKRTLFWISGCASRWDLTCAMSVWTVPVVLRPSAPEREIKSSFHLYNERESIKN